ncbi:enoyl-CoA hydratase [Microdochium trichocladiopsis]|uniref:Enoyl-CoA hydratase n=1 Tax=Microdochium trichocladiopsis TaxID=1682393 RepID=A0A9P8XRS1_9PEZI|nr:enoyl-CoA hydratase [Microdochium trichocladiopsis]KAH7014300.1 enoyl-CoA hydratase [Microdochium trichocladiopsis]
MSSHTPAPFQTSPPQLSCYTLSVPAPYTLLVTINRESSRNAITVNGHWEGDLLWAWFDAEPTLRVAIITGKGPKSFCAGQDLLEQHRKRGGKAEAEGASGKVPTVEDNRPSMPAGGFAGLSKRLGKKPVIAAVNGYAFGGGFEIALNCDLVIASPTATFALPEAQRGLWAAAGGLPRVVRIFGMQLATDLALTGRILTAKEVEHFGFARVSSSPESLIPEALELAGRIAEMSPDAVIVSRAGLRQAWETASVERATQVIDERFARALLTGENFRIGIKAFAEKKKPEWVPSKM